MIHMMNIFPIYVAIDYEIVVYLYCWKYMNKMSQTAFVFIWIPNTPSLLNRIA